MDTATTATIAAFGLAFLLFAAALWLQLRWLRQLKQHQAAHCALIQAAYDLIDPEAMQQARQTLAAQRPDATLGQVYEAARRHGSIRVPGYKFTAAPPEPTKEQDTQ